MVGGKNTFETENILHNILSTYFQSNVPFSGKEEPTTATGEEADAVHRRLLKVGLSFRLNFFCDYTNRVKCQMNTKIHVV